ncbi:MAG TPA: glycosyltransferase [Coriobacteriia bacterium]|nr:glycosyltransferase [Coriobacteriia bacterium]
MRRWEDSTFLFISTNPQHLDGGVEERWIPVMTELVALGAKVRFLAPMHSEMGEWARSFKGIQVDPYILDKWNVIRARSRLRKYLKRYLPVCAHSTGIEGDLLLRWASRKVPEVRVAHTVTAAAQATRRRKPINSLFFRFDEIGMQHADAVFVPTEALVDEVMAAGREGRHARRIILDTSDSPMRDSVDRHLEVYATFLVERGAAG